MTQFLSAIAERQELMKVNRGGNDVVSRFDRQHSILWWIARVSLPNAGGRYPGLIQMTEYAVGPEAADILAAFKLAGAKTDDLAPFYTMHIVNMPTDQKSVIFAETASPYEGMDILKACYNHREGEVLGLVPADDVVGDEAIADWKKGLLPNRDYLLEQAHVIRDDCRGVDERIRNLSKNHPDTYEPLAALHKTRASLLTGKIRVVNTMAVILLRQSTVTYVEELPRFRTISPEQRALHANLLAPLLELMQASQCFDWENEVSQNDTWQRFLRYESSVAAEIQRQKQERSQRKAEAEKQALERERVKQLEEQKKNQEHEKARRENRSPWHTEVAATMIAATVKRSGRTQEELTAIRDIVTQTNGVLAQEVTDISREVDAIEPATSKASNQPTSAELAQRLRKIEVQLRSNNAQAKALDASQSEEDMLKKIAQKVGLKFEVAPVPALFTGEGPNWCTDELCKRWAGYVTALACNRESVALERQRSQVHGEALEYMVSAYVEHVMSKKDVEADRKLQSHAAVAAWVLHQTQPGQAISDRIVDPKFSWASAWAFQHADLSDDDVAEVYRRLIETAPKFHNTGYTLDWEEQKEYEKARNSRPFGQVYESKVMSHLSDAAQLFWRAVRLQNEIKQLAAEGDPRMFTCIKEKDDILASPLSKIHEQTGKLLEDGIRSYRDRLQRSPGDSAGSDDAKIAVWLYLKPLLDVERASTCKDAEQRADVEATWSGFLGLYEKHRHENVNTYHDGVYPVSDRFRWEPFFEHRNR